MSLKIVTNTAPKLTTIPSGKGAGAKIMPGKSETIDFSGLTDSQKKWIDGKKAKGELEINDLSAEEKSKKPSAKADSK